MEFGCVAIGEKNHILVPNDVQIGYKIDTQIPIVNMTRHRLHYCINIYDQLPKSEAKIFPSSPSNYLDCKELDNEEMDEIEYSHTSSNSINSSRKFEANSATDIKVTENTKSSLTTSNSFTKTTIESKQSLDILNNWNKEKTSDQNKLSYVFKFDKLTGELGPNERSYLNLSFCPLKSVLYTVKAKCNLMCNDFPELVTILPVVIKGSGCKTQFKVRKNTILTIISAAIIY